MKKKIIATLIAAAIVAIALAPAAFAAPACPLQNATSGNASNILNQLAGTGSTPSTCPKTAALNGLLNGATAGNTPACPASSLLQSLLGGSNAGSNLNATSLQQLLGNLGITLPTSTSACQQQNGCTSGTCPTGNCQSGNCLTAGCSAGTCPNN